MFKAIVELLIWLCFKLFVSKIKYFFVMSQVVVGLIILAFSWSIGMTLIALACALPMYKVWWPLFVVFFHILTPLPLFCAFPQSTNKNVRDVALFITTGFIVSSMGLPIVLARAPVEPHPTIQLGACFLTLSGNVVIYLSYVGLCLMAKLEESLSF